MSIYDKTEQRPCKTTGTQRIILHTIIKPYLITISKTTLEEMRLMEGLFSAFGLIISFW
jgi:hypothetical protein